MNPRQYADSILLELEMEEPYVEDRSEPESYFKEAFDRYSDEPGIICKERTDMLRIGQNQAVILKRLSTGAATSRELFAKSNQLPQYFQITLNRLEKRGFISGEVIGDRIVYSLTPAGVETYERRFLGQENYLTD